ncbi:hypothetical protein THH46_04015 [Pseudomonas sp. NA13]
MRYSSNGVTSMCCETHKSFRRRIFKPTESNFRAQIKFVADGHRDTALMKIQRKTFIAPCGQGLIRSTQTAGRTALNSVPFAAVFAPLSGSRLSTGAQSGKP